MVCMTQKDPLHGDNIFGPNNRDPLYVWIESIQKYVSGFGTIYTEEEFYELDKMEREWQASLPNHNFQQLMEAYPGETKVARRGIKAQIKKYKQKLIDASEGYAQYYNEVIANAHFTEQVELKEQAEEKYDDLRKRLESKIKTYMFRLSYLDELEGKKEKQTGGIEESDIERAKQVPIESLYDGTLKKHGTRAVGSCPFHNENSASFTVYLDQNSWWCYGACSCGGSVVDYVMKQQSIDFLTAIKYLIK